MNAIDKLKNKIEAFNPLAIARRNKMRKRLKNTDITLLAPNCLGGILFHDLGLRFMSPTVNLMMTQKEFLQFILHLDEYLNGEFEFYKDSNFLCPCAFLKAGGVPDIVVHFTHYRNEEDALKYWNRRKERIDRDNMFVFIEERDGITEEELRMLSELKVKGIVAFTCNRYDNMPYAAYLPQYHADGEVGNILARHYLDDSREYEKIFDFVGWFNSANGGSYDVSEFLIKNS